MKDAGVRALTAVGVQCAEGEDFFFVVAHDLERYLVAPRGREWEVAQIDDRGKDQQFPRIYPCTSTS